MDAGGILVKQRNYFHTGATLDKGFRKKQLSLLRTLILSNRDKIIQALHEDFMKPEVETYTSEYAITVEELEYALKKIDRWARPERVKSSLINFPSSARIIDEPYGLALIISPWNYPFQLCMFPLIGAMAAGNCAILKPSEYAPATSALIAGMINNHFDPGYIHVITGDADTASALLDQQFDFIFFTGSSRVGRLVATSAARNLTPVVLELGGKNPCIVEKDFNLRLAARRIVWGKFFNGGQTCIAPDYIYVHKDVHDALIKELKEQIINFYGNDPKGNPDLARIINQKNFIRLKEQIDPRKVVFGGDCDEQAVFIHPTILDNVTWEDLVMQDEIFGPILPVLTYEDIDEVISILKTREKPLSLYLFTNRSQVQRKVLKETSFGGGAINDTLSHFINPFLPFGGIGMSGYGAYHGKFSFETFSHRKSILKRGSWLDIPLRYPPYTAGKIKMIKAALRLNIHF